MGPEKRLIAIPFAGGIDTKTDPKQVAHGKLLDLQNGIFAKTGAINRRWGYKKLGQGILGTSNQVGAAVALNAFNNELLLYDGLQAYSYIPAEDAWAPRGSIVSIIQTNQQIIRNASQQLSPDFGTLLGVEVYAWEDSRGGIRFSILDAVSGASIVNDQPLYAGMPATVIRPKVIACPTYGVIAIFFVDGSNYLNVVTINPLAPAAPVGGPFIALSTLPAPAVYDVAVAPNGAVYICAWQLTGLGPPAFAENLVLAKLRFAPFVVLNSTAIGSGSGAIPLCMPAISVDPATNGPFVAYASPPAPTSVIAQAFDVNLNILGSAGIVLIAAANVASITGTVSGSVLTVFCEVPGSAGNFIQTNRMTTAGVTTFAGANAPIFARSVGLASKAFTYAGNIYVNVAFQSNLQSTYFTLDQTGSVVAKVNAGLGGGLISNSDFLLPECPALSTGIFKYANLVKGLPNTEAGTVQALLGVNATKLDFFDSNQFLSAAINGALYTVGGILQVYDGAQYVEAGFNVYPEAVQYTPSAAGGFMLSGTYFYAVTYEWSNNLGQLDISAPSTANSVTVTGPTGSVQVKIPTLRLTKKGRVKLVVYRTQAGGTILLRVTSAIVPVYNDPTVDSITFTDTLADASIAGNGAMYTQPLALGQNPVLPNFAPPSCSLIATYADRLWLGGLDDPYLHWFSQPTLANSPMQFSSSLTYRIDPDGGPTTALARMDDKLVFFKKSAILYVTGQGPTPTGDLNDFATPIQIPAGQVGCSSQNSIVLTPIGLLFQSPNGIYLLDRGLNVSYKGAPVESFTSPSERALSLNSATLIPNQWAVFTTASGVSLVYDYYYDQWSTFTNHKAVDSALYLGGGNVFAWANALGQVFVQTPTVFTDAGAPIPFALTLAVNALEAIQGYQRVYHAMLLGTYKGTHTLRAECAYDYDDQQFTAMALIPSDSTLGITTFGTSSPFGLGTPFGDALPGQTVYQYRLDILRKCQRLVLRLSDLQTAPGNEGFSLSALTLVVGIKKGPFRVPATKQFGVS